MRHARASRTVSSNFNIAKMIAQQTLRKTAPPSHLLWWSLRARRRMCHFEETSHRRQRPGESLQLGKAFDFETIMMLGCCMHGTWHDRSRLYYRVCQQE